MQINKAAAAAPPEEHWVKTTAAARYKTAADESQSTIIKLRGLADPIRSKRTRPLCWNWGVRSFSQAISPIVASRRKVRPGGTFTTGLLLFPSIQGVRRSGRRSSLFKVPENNGQLLDGWEGMLKQQPVVLLQFVEMQLIVWCKTSSEYSKQELEKAQLYTMIIMGTLLLRLCGTKYVQWIWQRVVVGRLLGSVAYYTAICTGLAVQRLQGINPKPRRPTGRLWGMISLSMRNRKFAVLRLKGIPMVACVFCRLTATLER